MLTCPRDRVAVITVGFHWRQQVGQRAVVAGCLPARRTRVLTQLGGAWLQLWVVAGAVTVFNRVVQVALQDGVLEFGRPAAGGEREHAASLLERSQTSYIHTLTEQAGTHTHTRDKCQD